MIGTLPTGITAANAETAYIIRVQSTEINGGGPYKDYLFLIQRMSSDTSVRVVVTYTDDKGEEVKRIVVLPDGEGKDTVDVPIDENTVNITSIEVFPTDSYAYTGIDADFDPNNYDSSDTDSWRYDATVSNYWDDKDHTAGTTWRCLPWIPMARA